MASTSQDQGTTPKDIGSIGTEMQWLVLNPPFIIKPTQACQRAECHSRTDSVIRPEAVEPAKAASRPKAEFEALSKNLTGSWTTVSAQKAAFTESSRLANAAWTARPTEARDPAQKYRSNGVEDLWRPLHFLEEFTVGNLKEMMPSLSWRARMALGPLADDGEVNPAF